VKHTPGPWSTGCDEDGHMVYAADDSAVADALRDDGDAEAEVSNARLIAAAPDLLAACQVALAAYRLAGKDVPENSTAATLRSAIAKAEGQS
jgi:hypothetical protein